jgi:hypothetical protein
VEQAQEPTKNAAAHNRGARRKAQPAQARPEPQGRGPVEAPPAAVPVKRGPPAPTPNPSKAVKVTPPAPGPGTAAGQQKAAPPAQAPKPVEPSKR